MALEHDVVLPIWRTVTSPRHHDPLVLSASICPLSEPGLGPVPHHDSPMRARSSHACACRARHPGISGAIPESSSPLAAKMPSIARRPVIPSTRPVLCPRSSSLFARSGTGPIEIALQLQRNATLHPVAPTPPTLFSESASAAPESQLGFLGIASIIGARWQCLASGFYHREPFRSYVYANG